MTSPPLRDDIAYLLFAHNGKPRKRRAQQVEAVGKCPPPSDPAAWRCCHFQVLDTSPHTGYFHPHQITTGQASSMLPTVFHFTHLRRQPWFFWGEGVPNTQTSPRTTEAAERPGSVARGVLSTHSWWSAFLLTPRAQPEKMRTIRSSSWQFTLAVI